MERGTIHSGTIPPPPPAPRDQITNIASHILWLWLAYAGLVTAGISGYLRLNAADVEEERRASMMQLDIKVRLTAIETQLSNMNCTLMEVKADLVKAAEKANDRKRENWKED
jgi:hypothetical protein